MASLRRQSFSKKNTFVVRRIVKPGELAVAELAVKFGRLKRERVDPGRMAAEGGGALFGLGDQPAAESLPAQIGMNPEQVDEQPSGIGVTDKPAPDRVVNIAQEN